MKRNNKIIIDWIRFDSKEEAIFYNAIINNKLDELTGIEELKWAKLISADPSPFSLFETFKAGDKTVRGRRYTHDFDILLGGVKISLELKSTWTEKKPDYRLRRAIFLNLYNKKINFMELIYIRKGIWNLIKYY